MLDHLLTQLTNKIYNIYQQNLQQHLLLFKKKTKTNFFWINFHALITLSANEKLTTHPFYMVFYFFQIRITVRFKMDYMTPSHSLILYVGTIIGLIMGWHLTCEWVWLKAEVGQREWLSPRQMFISWEVIIGLKVLH